jgi:type II secretory pathway pseudopilin PulG
MKHYYNSIENSNGYTLIELVVTVGIILTLTFVCFNGLFTTKANMDLNLAAHQLEATLKDCQSKAMYTGSYYKINFQPPINRYVVSCDYEVERTVWFDNINLHYTNFDHNQVGFNKRGVPSMGGTVTLKTKYGKTLYVIMTPVTARTRISTTPPANW